MTSVALPAKVQSAADALAAAGFEVKVASRGVTSRGEDYLTIDAKHGNDTVEASFGGNGRFILATFWTPSAGIGLRTTYSRQTFDRNVAHWAEVYAR